MRDYDESTKDRLIKVHDDNTLGHENQTSKAYPTIRLVIEPNIDGVTVYLLEVLNLT